jgi:hypothetical protein
MNARAAENWSNDSDSPLARVESCVHAVLFGERGEHGDVHLRLGGLREPGLPLNALHHSLLLVNDG